MAMHSLVGHYVQPSSWDYSPETEAIGWTHGSLGSTAESRQLLWIVHWFVLFLSDRRTDVSVVGYLSSLTTSTGIFAMKRRSRFADTLSSLFANRKRKYLRRTRKGPVYLSSSEGCSLSTRTSTCFVLQISCGTRVRNFSFPCQGFSLKAKLY